MKAKSLDRVELTRRKMAFKEAMKHAADTPAYPGAEEHQEPTYYDACPYCGGKLTHESGCVKCIACGWSKCG